MLFVVPKRDTKKTLIRNLRALMERREDSTYTLAKRSGIPQRTVVNILSGKHKVSVEAAESLARAYGLEGWHLLIHDLPDGINTARLSKLYDAYFSASEEGRDHIFSVAEREAKYQDRSA